QDPICGMDVNPGQATAKYDYAGKTYFFCCEHCLERFKKEPEKYAGNGSSALGVKPPESQLPAEPGTFYICPMDPEVREPKPGACPKCGMALEPETIAVPVTKTEYTCPMHPEIVQDGPGSCPICGMALEPRT
ncbi:MAG: YHS domain-containing protein, partial [Deltaproteobacteria bacterium]|nr:YHS domain-containing protein [Deltaproteobacteria bacterium]